MYTATTAPPPTTTGVIPTYAPSDLLYARTTNYHWPTFSANQTNTVGNWKEETGYGEGPFGFGKSIKFKEDECMADSKWVENNDVCALNPKDCPDGLTVSIWEKNTYDPVTLIEYQKTEFPRKYLVSSGADFDRETAEAYPGFAIYREGPNIVGVVSTGEEVWELVVTGQVYDQEWTNIGIRWKKPDLFDLDTPISKLGGLEMFINTVSVGTTLMPEKEDKEGTQTFTSKVASIDGKTPPVVSIGCAWNYETGEFDRHSGGEYDELAMWTRQLVKNATHNELPFMYGGYSPDFSDVSAEAFNAMLGNVDLANDNQAGLAQEVLKAMLLGPATTTPAIPTRTLDPNLVTSTESPEPVATTAQTTTVKQEIDPFKAAKTQLETQKALQNMLLVESNVDSKTPDEAQQRLALAKVAAKLLDGDNQNVEKWRAVEEKYPHEEGAPKTLRQMEDYMLAYVGSVNITATDAQTAYFNKRKGTMNFYTFGRDFVMNVDKMDAATLREGVRKTYPNYRAAEWVENKKKWENPNDTYSVPTGMFKDQEGCNDKPVTISATILNRYGAASPRRRNIALVRGAEWNIDSKVVSTKASCNPDTILYDHEEVAKCTPDLDYMKENPVRATLYHKKAGKARIVRRRNLLFHTDMKRSGIEVRQCVLWNEDFGYNGAWDPTECRLVVTDADKTTCECFRFGAMAVLVEMSDKFEVNDKCFIPEILKYVGMGFTAVFLLLFIVMTFTKKHIWDMFHVLRLHVCISWLCALGFHIVTDFESIREDAHMNLLIGMLMIYSYIAAATWMVCEAHATFKAFTGGIISGRTAVYTPFGYGTPVTLIGLLFLFFYDELGTDPRCFIAWDDTTKSIFFYYMFGVAGVGVIFAFIILFNMAKPQTRRKNVVSDLTAQARGTCCVCFAMFFFWIFGYFTYMRNPESETPDLYCPFIVTLGWFGAVIIFVAYGLCSTRFRHGMRSEQAIMAQYLVEDDTTAETTSVSSRPTSVASLSSRVTSASEKPPPSPVPVVDEESPEGIAEEEDQTAEVEAEEEVDVEQEQQEAPTEEEPAPPDDDVAPVE